MKKKNEEKKKKREMKLLNVQNATGNRSGERIFIHELILFMYLCVGGHANACHIIKLYYIVSILKIYVYLPDS